MDLLGHISDSDGDGPVVAPPLPTAPPAQAPGRCAPRTEAVARAREAKADKAFRLVEGAQADALVEMYRGAGVVRHKYHVSRAPTKRFRGKRVHGGLRVVRKGLKRVVGGNQRAIGFTEIARVCEMRREKVTSIATRFDILPVWARQIRAFYASAFLAQQARVLGWSCRIASLRKPTFSFSRLAFDETGQAATTQAEGASAEQQASVWPVMLLRATLLVSWADIGVVALRLCIPPVLATTPGDANVGTLLESSRSTAAERCVGRRGDVWPLHRRQGASPGDLPTSGASVRPADFERLYKELAAQRWAGARRPSADLAALVGLVGE